MKPGWTLLSLVSPEQLEAESAYLQDEIKLDQNFENIAGKSDPLKYVLNRVELVAPTDSPVLIMAAPEPGTPMPVLSLLPTAPLNKKWQKADSGKIYGIVLMSFP